MLLAAKVISSEEPDGEIEEFVVRKALENIKAPSMELQTESVLVLLELDRITELTQNIPALTIETNDQEVFRQIAMKLNLDECLLFLSAILKQNYTGIKEIARTIIDVCSVKDYEYSISVNNMSILKEVADILNSLWSQSIKKSVRLLQFYIIFNVPKEMTTPKLLEILSQGKIFVKKYNLVQQIAKKYNIDLNIIKEN